MRRFALVWLLLLLAAQTALARPLTEAEIPEPLRPWQGWVLFPHTDRDCPLRYSEPVRHCLWPSALSLDLAADGGTFEQEWQVYRTAWVPLPGESRHWPEQITVDGHNVLPVGRNGVPSVELEPGDHRITGAFRWQRLPESLAIPDATGLVALQVDGQPRPEPVIGDGGRLWLSDRTTAARERTPEDRLRLEVFRRVVDDLPLQVHTRLQIEVSGTAREVLLPAPLLKDAMPLELSSPLPARLEEDGRLRLQVRPGRWQVNLTSRFPGPVESLALNKRPTPWPAEEIWAFEARPNLRLVEPGGVPQVDPRQTRLPPEWQNLPAFRVLPGEQLSFKVIRRGDPEPEPDNLRLVRQLWLDFDGGGYTFSDSITGTMTRGWRLDADPEVDLGRVTLDGQPQFITTLPGGDRRGVEVRRGRITLSADSRYSASRSDLPAGGWGREFQRVTASLHLPPGWHLLTVTGVDNVPASWVQRWTLLDLFVVLIAAVAVARLWGWSWGALALVTLALVWHEPFAPRWVWLYLLASVALLRVLPPGRFRRFAQTLRALGLLALLVIGLPFLVNEARVGLYPQLEQPWTGVWGPIPQMLMEPEGAADAARPVPAAPMQEALESLASRSVGGKTLRAERPKVALDAYTDPNAIVQTGPGLPEWQWRTVELGWNGPVPADQRISLFLLSPPMNLFLNLLRMALVCVLGWRIALWARGGLSLKRLNPATGALLLLPLLLMGAPERSWAAYPSEEMLKTLEQRLLAPPDCLPACADMTRMGLTVSNNTLDARLTVTAATATAIPLPLDVRHTTPVSVLLDDAPANLSRSDDGTLWAQLPAGAHELLLRARLPAQRQVQIPLPLPPHRVEATANGWQVEGIRDDGVPERQLVLTRLQQEQAVEQTLQPTALPPFVRVERILRLGLQWSVETRVVRLSPPGVPVALRIPLLPGEAVVTEGITVRDQHALITLDPAERSRQWSSRLEQRNELTLTAAQTADWVELWRADVSPLWHVATSGIPVVHHQDQSRRWLPEWRPWPGETVTLAVSRPEGVPGQTLTIDQSQLMVTPGKRATDAVLTLRLRSSQGGRHEITLPPGAELQSVVIDGRTQPIRQEGRTVALPVVPGTRTYRLTWREAAGVESLWHSPAVSLGIPSTNASLNVRLGHDRWVLYTLGPRLGPAVLFWGVLLVIVLAAVALGRTRPLTPLGALSWLLLGIGLSQGPVWSALVVAGWLFALGLRGRMPMEMPKVRFNLVQVGLGLLTLWALTDLFDVVQQGLLGLPDMQVAGNQSSAYELRWYQDLAAAELPQGTVLSASLFLYRALMLAWALWLAFALVGWLRWGWEAFSRDGLWRRLELKKSEKAKAKDENAPSKT